MYESVICVFKTIDWYIKYDLIFNWFWYNRKKNLMFYQGCTDNNEFKQIILASFISFDSMTNHSFVSTFKLFVVLTIKRVIKSIIISFMIHKKCFLPFQTFQTFNIFANVILNNAFQLYVIMIKISYNQATRMPSTKLIY